MRTRLPAVLLLALLTACGGAEPVAAPALSSPSSPPSSPSPSPQPVLFDAAAVKAALLAQGDVPAGYVPPQSVEGFEPPTSRRDVRLCDAPAGVRPPPVPPAPFVVYQGKAGFDGVVQSVAVLPDEDTAVAVLAAVQRHAARCEPTSTETIGAGTFSLIRATTLAAVVPLASGQWRGVRQSSTTTAQSGGSVQRWQTQTAVLRRGNAVLQLEVSGETAPPDLAAFLTPAVAKLDATLPPG